jgi:hypothetical protein
MTQQAPTNMKKGRQLLAIAGLILCIAYFSWDSIAQIRHGSSARPETQSYSVPDPEAQAGKTEPDHSPDATIFFVGKRGGGGVLRPKKTVDR